MAVEKELTPHKKEFGKSFAAYFQKLAEQADKNLNETAASLRLPSDSFGQWREADAGQDDDDLRKGTHL